MSEKIISNEHQSSVKNDPFYGDANIAELKRRAGEMETNATEHELLDDN